MRDLNELNKYRETSFEISQYGIMGNSGNGVFSIRQNGLLHVIASDGGGWDHVSVSRKDRTPTWEEMEVVKRLFFKDSEAAMQLHVKPADHLNHCKNCLHIWRPQQTETPLPPSIMVALRKGEELWTGNDSEIGL